MNNLLYIGLNGYAGAGKDTVAKMLYVILNWDWKRKEDAYELFKRDYATNVRPYATIVNKEDNMCTCIAFADRLKKICSDMFGIPLENFYYNKNSAWICINKDFEYTEEKPSQSEIITALDYYTCKDNYMNSNIKYYMSLREILVYVGTYVCQYEICKNVFVNSVANTIMHNLWYNKKLKYIICTDVRFIQEYEFIKNNNGIMINIIRSSVLQADDIAEHEMDIIDPENYNYVIYNDGSYEDLFDEIWRITHETLEFTNTTIDLPSITNSKGTYLRLIDDNTYRLCTPNGINRITHSMGRIVSIYPQGGPQLVINEQIPGINLVVTDIEFNEDHSEYIISTTN